ncbi:hypothetical protein FDI90_gp093 [Pseudomonas phage PA7]|uniref:Uncharacterized protein n=1 Tax=Pseudomonas phage PA7 TaxID=347330 RepID=I7DKD8_9CAUD|nr:hypothetical protein FDI90_gp093 [Pseudomonas phage PA7]AFO70900.1 hypothetical protein [Pseudomonas phage PA7]QXN68410.1 hypothetical protein [Pseudomonas phage PA7]
MNDQADLLIEYYKSRGLGGVMATHNLHTQINEHHTIYGGGWTEETEKAAKSIRRRMKRNSIVEINVWKKK